MGGVAVWKERNENRRSKTVAYVICEAFACAFFSAMKYAFLLMLRYLLGMPLICGVISEQVV